MPRLKHALPRYRLHASGQAVITVGGIDHYVGPFGSAASYRARDQLVAQWLANGRELPGARPAETVLLVKGFVAHYWKFAKKYYVKDGEPTGELSVIKPALRRLCSLFANLPASELKPVAIQELQSAMVREDLARTYINQQVQRIRRMYRWGVSQGLVPVETYQALACADGLKKGRTEARETEPVGPVADEVVQRTLPHLPRVVADLVQFQRLAGCRPAEACNVRPIDIEKDDQLWWYAPRSHKTAHHGHDRRIAVGPRAQAILQPYLNRAPQEYCFSPADSETKRHRGLRKQRRTPVQPSQQNRRKARPSRTPGERYDTRSYNRAIARACKRAGVVPWHANQLRHAAGTAARRKYGLEGAQALLGQKRLETTQIYACRRDDLAARLALEIG